MTMVYVNFPNSYINIHYDDTCRSIRQMEINNQRVIQINIVTISAECQGFANNEYVFENEAGVRDMWINMAFQNRAFEEAVTRYINFLLGQHYQSFSGDRVSVHCG